MNVVDKLGNVQAQIAALAIKEAQYKEEIRALGDGTHSGLLFESTVSTYTKAPSVPRKTLIAKLRLLGVSARWFTNHEKESDPVTSVTCIARKGHNLRRVA